MTIYSPQQLDNIPLQSGRTIGNLKKEAKKIRKDVGSYSKALDFLAQKNSYQQFKTWQKAIENLPFFYLEEMRGRRISADDVRTVLYQHPKLTWSGYDCIFWGANKLSSLDEEETKNMSDQEWTALRNETIAEEHQLMFLDIQSLHIESALCCEVFDQLKATRRLPRKRIASLSAFKHVVERYGHATNKAHNYRYISRGAVAIAAIYKGFSVTSTNEWMGINVCDESLEYFLKTTCKS
ncbi:hypothetical protein [Thalassolituus oleivorans]|uniref:hypothetical protein n=1 Tax=Thalassolituus oleivorans TaxID=187493 RepID=UPI0023EF681D|nr:hypothetical protein [Thalassolituus oleivorans]